jgi:putative cell wall-binding protein
MLTRTLRTLSAATLALSLAVVLPVVLVGPIQAAPRPHPVVTSMESRPLIPTSRARATALGGRSAAESPAVRLDGPVHVVGVTWTGRGPADGEVEIREQRDGRWGPWTTMHVDPGHGPDPEDGAASAGREGTDPWVSTADAVQTRVVTRSRALGVTPRLDVVDPGRSDADVPAPVVAGGASARAARPTIYTRRQWGADESIRTHTNTFGVVKAAVVHHTVGSNDYTASEVPAIIRGIYRFHTVDRGWGDIGYNFLIDRFGRTWEGRYGGIDKPVVGAHALGVNSQTYGASILGDYTSTAPSTAALTAQAKLAAWKLGLSYVDPTATTVLDGYGTFRTVNGHRDSYATSCPGQRVYDKLGWIRTRAKAYQGTMFYGPSVSPSRVAYDNGGATVKARAGADLSWKLTVRSPCRRELVATVRGSASAGQTFSAAWDGRLPDGTPAPPGDYRLHLSASNGRGALATARPVTFVVTVATAAGAPPGFCPPRLMASDRYSFNVAAARRVSSTTRVVLVNGTTNGMPLAFVAGPLARADGAVLLQTHSDYLPDQTRAEMVRRGVTDVTVVGGPAWVSDDVLAQIEALGVAPDHITRITGNSRYEVAANVARQIAGGAPAPDVLLASGPESSISWLAVAGPASALRRPILLTRSDALPAATASALDDLGVQHVVVAGGPRTVSDAVTAAVPDPRRLSASNRYALSVVVADWARAEGVDVSRVFVGSGSEQAWPNTVSAAQKGWPELYVSRTSVPADVDTWLRANTDLTRLDILGNSRGVSMVTGGDAQEAVRD